MLARKHKVLSVIPARGGSKGVPHKNIRVINGKRMIEFTIDAARSAAMLSRTIVSTDDEDIAKIALRAGADVPFRRPKNLATDTSDSVSVGLHALDFCENQDKCAFDLIVLLQPTAPLRTAFDIDATVKLLLENPDYNTAITVTEVETEHPNYLYSRRGHIFQYNADPSNLGGLRQKFPTYFVRTGAVYAARTAFFREHKSFMEPQCLAHVMPRERSVNVDSLFDLKLVEFILTSLKH